MDELWAAADDLNAGESSGDGISYSYGHDREAMEEDEASSEEGEHGEEEDEEDDDRDRPAKRLRGKQPLAHLQQSMLSANSQSSQSQEAAAEGGSPNRAGGRTAKHASAGDLGGLGRAQASDNDHADAEDEDEEEDEDDDNRNEVIEIFSDEEEEEEEEDEDEDDLLGCSSTSILNRESMLRSTPSPAADLARGLAASANASDTTSDGAARGIVPQDSITTSSLGRWCDTGRGNVGDYRVDAAMRAHDSTSKSRKFVGASMKHCRIGRTRSELTMARAGTHGADSGSEVDSKMSPEELAADEGLARVGSSPAVPMISAEVGVESATVRYRTTTASDIRGTMVSSPFSTTSAAVTKEFPWNLECAICFDPIAVVALFACGHGACWECAHEWCSRVRQKAFVVNW